MSNSDSQNNSPASNPLSQFLTPEAMLTPGVAGALTMMITNALTVNFSMPRAWVGLGLSFVFGLLVLVTTRNLLQKAVFYVLNSLVIFCVAAGANGLGAGASQRVSLSLTTTAFAQDITSSQKQQTLEYCSNLSAAVAEAQKANQPPDKILELIKPCQTVSKDILRSGIAGGANSVTQPTGRFFSPWKF
ncbi:hypothetical protein [Bradyrhizobium sp. Leo170]|uniref:hypothetical protein n=1 Tax=Bradyrhizobium sp. Leo170 TaxID=1571199 RepID=UPI00102E259D|nr:hypothetical protein [Bradyrhizobium sp. Leo170]